MTKPIKLSKYERAVIRRIKADVRNHRNARLTVYRWDIRQRLWFFDRVRVIECDTLKILWRHEAEFFFRDVGHLSESCFYLENKTFEENLKAMLKYDRRHDLCIGEIGDFVIPRPPRSERRKR